MPVERIEVGNRSEVIVSIVFQADIEEAWKQHAEITIPLTLKDSDRDIELFSLCSAKNAKSSSDAADAKLEMTSMQVLPIRSIK
eukprot:CAMPEP_0194218962 /NCGR_PEP_ID=MMETSP0156-20130528/24901_1 /TAXON_ID=33649 /ORGANISM="Thalassionema nitzschioides, Strain L26-B" /LENGTH=83 /DNA_ID=CAMNT_0038948477 /DNA_START=643 /DNA_END=894 /DNA_ORIENTATION=+